MKKTIRHIFQIPAVLLACAAAAGCAKEVPGPASLYEGDYTISSQAEVDSFSPKESVNSVTISGGDITDISSLDIKAAGTIIIKETGIENLVLPKVASISSGFEISGNEKLVSIKDLGLKFCIGDIGITNNPVLTDIRGLMSLKKMSGKLTVSGNASLGEDKTGEPDTYGFNVIKYLISNSILDITKVSLSDNHPKAATDPSLIGQGESDDGIYSYEIKSDAEANALSVNGGIVRDLTISGETFTDAGLASLGNTVKTVLGTLTIDGAAITTTENFFEKVDCQGSIILKNLQGSMSDGTNNFFNTNGFKSYTHIKGDLVLENIPYLIHWGPGNGFAQITTVDGNLTVRNSGMQQLAFSSLTSVGGSLTIDNCCIELYTGFLWNLATKLTTIGGDFIYTGNDHVNGLGGFEGVTHIGGNVTITGNGTDPSAGGIPYENMEGRTGFVLVQQWISTGVIQPDATVDCRYADGTEVEFSYGIEPQSYVITGRDELLAFAPQDESAIPETVQDLTVIGNGDQISDHDMSFIKTRVKEIKGNLVIDGISGLTTTESMLMTNGSGFTVGGSIVFRNCPELFNLNAFRFISSVGGDLVFENCPKIATTWGSGQCLSIIETIAGNLVISGVTESMSGLSLEKLKTIGGDMTITGNNGAFYNFNGMALESIGGSLTISDNVNFNGLGGFESLKSVGGNVTITGNGASSGYIPVQSAENQTGLELLGTLHDAGVFSDTAVFTIESNGIEYTIDEL